MIKIAKYCTKSNLPNKPLISSNEQPKKYLSLFPFLQALLFIHEFCKPSLSLPLSFPSPIPYLGKSVAGFLSASRKIHYLKKLHQSLSAKLY